MGDRASRSVIGNSRPLFFRSSYTHTTPESDGTLRNASAHALESTKTGIYYRGRDFAEI